MEVLVVLILAVVGLAVWASKRERPQPRGYPGEERQPAPTQGTGSPPGAKSGRAYAEIARSDGSFVTVTKAEFDGILEPLGAALKQGRELIGRAKALDAAKDRAQLAPVLTAHVTELRATADALLDFHSNVSSASERPYKRIAEGVDKLENLAGEIEDILHEWETGEAAEGEAEDFDDEEGGYAAFVEEMWKRPGVDGKGVELRRGAGGPICRLVSVVGGANGQPYVNVIENGERKTFAGDDRHRWERDGHRVDGSAFAAILRGVEPERALGPDPHPASAEQALRPEYDRWPTKDRRFVIGYENSRGERSYRVISRVVRQQDTFSARCHFRWGTRRTFLFEGLREVLDAKTGEVIPVAEFTRPAKRG